MARRRHTGTRSSDVLTGLCPSLFLSALLWASLCERLVLISRHPGWQVSYKPRSSFFDMFFHLEQPQPSLRPSDFFFQLLPFLNFEILRSAKIWLFRRPLERNGLPSSPLSAFPSCWCCKIVGLRPSLKLPGLRTRLRRAVPQGAAVPNKGSSTARTAQAHIEQRLMRQSLWAVVLCLH